MGIEMKPYYRPLSLESYAYLLKKAGDKARVLAGGEYPQEAGEVKKGEVLIDLQALKLDQVSYQGDNVHIGGLCNLNMLMLACSGLPGLVEAVRHQAGTNVRNTLSLANFLRSGFVGQSSPLLCALLALDARILPILESDTAPLSNYFLKSKAVPITAELILPRSADFRFAQVGRSEMDLPQVCLGVLSLKNDQLRVAIDAGKRFIFTGDKESVSRDIAKLGSELDDQWAGSDYRRKALLVLLERLLEASPERKETK